MSTERTLQIRIGAAKRLTKEMKSRRVDVETEKKRTERLISEGEDQWTVGKQVFNQKRINFREKWLQKQRR
jgi:hypothetical protein